MIRRLSALIGCLAVVLVVAGCPDQIAGLDPTQEISVTLRVTEDITADTSGSLVNVHLMLQHPEIWGSSGELPANERVRINDQLCYTDNTSGTVERTDLQLQGGDVVTIEVWEHLRDFSVPYAPLYSAPTETEVAIGDTLHFAWLQAPSSQSQYLRLSTPDHTTLFSSKTDSSDAAFVDFIVPAEVDTFSLYYTVYYKESDPDNPPWVYSARNYQVTGTYVVQQP